jgi:hypothetical protein
MGGTLCLRLETKPFEFGMLRLLSVGTLPICGLLLTLPMGGTSYLVLETARFESSVLRLVLQLAPL